MSTRDGEGVLDRLCEATRVDADQTAQCESVLNELVEAVCACAPSTTVPDKVLAYFHNSIYPKLQNNLKVCENASSFAASASVL